MKYLLIIAILLSVKCTTTKPQAKQLGLLKIIMVNGQYTDSIGNFTPKEPIEITWLHDSVNRIIIEPDEILIQKR